MHFHVSRISVNAGLPVQVGELRSYLGHQVKWDIRVDGKYEKKLF
jgi:hypothetical protein